MFKYHVIYVSYSLTFEAHSVWNNNLHVMSSRTYYFISLVHSTHNASQIMSTRTYYFISLVHSTHNASQIMSTSHTWIMCTSVDMYRYPSRFLSSVICRQRNINTISITAFTTFSTIWRSSFEWEVYNKHERKSPYWLQTARSILMQNMCVRQNTCYLNKQNLIIEIVQWLNCLTSSKKKPH